ncbi:DUF1588 domain-containing protein [Bdellovibrio bacteriovorus]|uniref:DUF1588 domain-containing protein n=1 Tax=Bdellovibrio bacteriovorus TaxID=959 RepID=UPI0035A6E8A5
MDKKTASRLCAFFVVTLPLMLGFQNCSALYMGEPQGRSESVPLTEDLQLGQKLYTQNCANCHGSVKSSAKRSRTAEQISIAIKTESQMRMISLTQKELDLIAQALSPEAYNPPPVVNEDNRQVFACTPGQMQKTPMVRLTNREYRGALFGLLDDFATTLKTDATLLEKIEAIPTDIATENRDTLKEQSLLMTAPISNALFESAFRASELVAGATTGLRNYPNTGQCLNAATITQSCHQQFVRELGSRAFRRPLSVTEANEVAARFWDAGLAKSDLLKVTFTGLVTMPDSLYKVYDRGSAVVGSSTVLSLSAHELATKMAFFLTGAPPDSALKALADNGQILDETVLDQQADRLLSLPGAQDMIRRLFRESYGYDVYDRLQYDSAYIGGVSTAGLDDVMTAELDSYFVEVVLNRKGSFLDIMTSRYTNATDGRMGVIYNVNAVTSTLPEERSGFLSRAAMLTKRSGYTASPIKRGLSIIEHVLCQDIGLPPPSAPTSLPVLTEDLITTRYRTVHSTEASGTTCMGCHSRFNNLGYAFESFDSFGRYRTSETVYKNSQAIGSLPVDTSFTTSEITGKSVSGNGARQMSEQLGMSDRALMCFTKHLKRFEARIPADANANCQMNRSLASMYGDNTTQGSVVGAIKALVLSPEFRRWKY